MKLFNEEYMKERNKAVGQSDITLIHGDCLEVMKDLPNDSVDMVCCDMPYG